MLTNYVLSLLIILSLVYRRIIMNKDITLKSALLNPYEALITNQEKIKENKAKSGADSKDLKVSIENVKLGSQNLAISLLVIPIISAAYVFAEAGKATLTFVAVVLCVPQALDLIYGENASRPDMSLKAVYAHLIMTAAYVGSTLGTPLAGLVNTDWVIELNQKLRTDHGQINAEDVPPPLEPVRTPLTKEERAQLKAQKKEERQARHLERMKMQEEVKAAKIAARKAVRLETKKTEPKKADQEAKEVEAKPAANSLNSNDITTNPQLSNTREEPEETTVDDSAIQSSTTEETVTVVNEQSKPAEIDHSERKAILQKQKTEAKEAKTAAIEKKNLERGQKDLKKAILDLAKINSECDVIIEKMELLKTVAAKAQNSELAKKAQDDLQLISNQLQARYDEAEAEVNKNKKVTNDSYQVPPRVIEINQDIFNAIKQTIDQLKKTKTEIQLSISAKIAEEKKMKAAEKAKLQAYQQATFFQKGMHNWGIRTIKA